MARTDEERFKVQYVRLKREATAQRELAQEQAKISQGMVREIQVERPTTILRPAPIQRTTFVPQQPQIQQPKKRPRFFTLFSLPGVSPIDLQGAYVRAIRTPRIPLW